MSARFSIELTKAGGHRPPLQKRAVDAFVIRRAQFRSQFLAELTGVRRGLMRKERRVVFPHSENGEVVCARRVLLKNVISDVPVVGTASNRLNRQQYFGLIFSGRRNVNVRDRVKHAVGGFPR